MPRPVKLARGLFKNGNRYWLRVAGEKRSTGTDHPDLANRVLGAIRLLERERKHLDLLYAARDGTLPVLTLYEAAAAGNLAALRAELVRAAVVDVDLEPLVEQWATTHLASRSLTERTRTDYVRLVRALIPSGKRFPASAMTEDKVQSTLHALPVSDATRRRHAAAWKLWIQFVRRRVPAVGDVFAFSRQWMPKNAPSRTLHWTHAQTIAVLDRMSGEPRRAMALIFGTGMELGALQRLTFADLGADRRTVVAHGTKNEARRDRTVLIDAWASKIFYDGLALGFPTMRVFSLTESELRESFYKAQVLAGVVTAPERGKNTNKMVWGKVAGLHRIHDARHTYAVVRLLGSDNEKPRLMRFIASQLGHVDETMLIKVYLKAGVEQRLDLMKEDIGKAEEKYQTS